MLHKMEESWMNVMSFTCIPIDRESLMVKHYLECLPDVLLNLHINGYHRMFAPFCSSMIQHLVSFPGFGRTHTTELSAVLTACGFL